MREYYRFLKDEIINFEGDFPKYVLYIPDFFRLLCKLTEENIDVVDKRKINSALAYFVIPNDAIPEDMYGPAGYIDDVYICCHVLIGLKEKYGIEILNKCWEGEENFEKVLELSYNESKKELEEKGLLEEVLKIACLGYDDEKRS
jgi:uncharacterized membrane protein YkvA (DUF1232 family)